jgi:hypothetical protein
VLGVRLADHCCNHFKGWVRGVSLEEQRRRWRRRGSRRSRRHRHRHHRCGRVLDTFRDAEKLLVLLIPVLPFFSFRYNFSFSCSRSRTTQRAFFSFFSQHTSDGCLETSLLQTRLLLPETRDGEVDDDASRSQTGHLATHKTKTNKTKQNKTKQKQKQKQKQNKQKPTPPAQTHTHTQQTEARNRRGKAAWQSSVGEQQPPLLL